MDATTTPTQAIPVLAGIAPGAGLSLESLNPLQLPDWDTQLKEHPEATIFHSAAWARVLIDTYRFRPTYLTQRDAHGKILGLLALMETGSLWRGRRLISLPFTDGCPPLTPDPCPKSGTPSALSEPRLGGCLEDVSHSEPLLAAALRLATSRNARFLELRDSEVWTKNLLPSVTFHGHRIPLKTSEEDQLTLCSPSMRRGLRKGERSGLRLKEGRDLVDIEAYYELHCQTRQRHGLPPQSLGFFRNIHRHVLAQGQGFVLLALAEDTPVAGAVFFTFGHHALYKFGASSETHLEFRPNNLVLWRGIRRCAELGFRVLDLGRTSLDNDGLRRFKLGLGGEERLIQCVRQDVRLGCILVTPDRAHGWHNRVFRLLPRPISRVLGSILYPLTA